MERSVHVRTEITILSPLSWIQISLKWQLAV